MSLRISLANWTAHNEYLRDIRRRVFIEEQSVPPELEWDEHDESAIHLVALEGNEAIGCVRLVQEGSVGYIGRMAVLLPHRKQGTGSTLLKAIEDYATNVAKITILHANVQAQAYLFYQRQGYHPASQFNWDAGIVHIGMRKEFGVEKPLSKLFIPGHDDHHYVFDDPVAAAGMLHIAAKTRLHAINLMITDLRQPKSIWKDKTLYTALTSFLRYSSRRSVNVLLGKEFSGIADHPFVQWQQRLTSRVKLHVHSEVARDLIILQPYGLIEIKPTNVTACLNDKVRTVKAMNLFTDMWANSAPSQEARRLRI